MYKDIDLKTSKKSIENIEAIKASINNILSTEIGTLPGNPAFGSNLHQFIFSLIGPLEKELIKEEVVERIEMWEDRIKIIDIQVTDNPDYNQILINLIFEVEINGEKIQDDVLVTINK